MKPSTDSRQSSVNLIHGLVRKLEEFGRHLREGLGVFHEAATDIGRYTAMLGIQSTEGAVAPYVGIAD